MAASRPFFGACALLAAAAATAAAASPDLAPLPPFGHGLRPYFYFEDNFTQLNHGAYGGTPRPVLEAQFRYQQEMEASLDNFMNGATGYRQCILEARATLGALVNAADVNDTVLVDNASEAINAILRNFEPALGPDQWLLDLSTAYGPFQGLYAWLGVRTGLQTLTVPIAWPVTGPDSFLAPVRAALEANASSLNIRVAVISHISAYPAVVLPVRELVELLHSFGIPVVVDGAHALGNIPINLQNLGDPEYYFANAHKWYFAPKSAALMYVRRDRQLLHVPAPAVVDNIETQPFIERFIWTGTRDRTPYCAIQDATAFRAALGGEAAVQLYTSTLALWSAHFLSDLWGTAPMAPDTLYANSSLVSVQIPTSNGTACGVLSSTLRGTYGLGVSGWTTIAGPPLIQCYFRISAQVYLERSDIERLGALTLQILRELGALEGPALLRRPEA